MELTKASTFTRESGIGGCIWFSPDWGWNSHTWNRIPISPLASFGMSGIVWHKCICSGESEWFYCSIKPSTNPHTQCPWRSEQLTMPMMMSFLQGDRCTLAIGCTKSGSLTRDGMHLVATPLLLDFIQNADNKPRHVWCSEFLILVLHQTYSTNLANT